LLIQETRGIITIVIVVVVVVVVIIIIIITVAATTTIATAAAKRLNHLTLQHWQFTVNYYYNLPPEKITSQTEKRR